MCEPYYLEQPPLMQVGQYVLTTMGYVPPTEPKLPFGFVAPPVDDREIRRRERARARRKTTRRRF